MSWFLTGISSGLAVQTVAKAPQLDQQATNWQKSRASKAARSGSRWLPVQIVVKGKRKESGFPAGVRNDGRD